MEKKYMTANSRQFSVTSLGSTSCAKKEMGFIDCYFIFINLHRRETKATTDKIEQYFTNFGEKTEVILSDIWYWSLN